MNLSPTLLPPSNAVLVLRMECPQNPPPDPRQLCSQCKNLRVHSLWPSVPSFHRWHHFTYNTQLIGFSLGTKEHLANYTSSTVGLEFLKIMSIEQLFFCFCKLFMSFAHLLPLKHDYLAYLFLEKLFV